MSSGQKITVADEVWISTAILQKQHPDRDFTIQEILEQARREAIYGELRPGVYVHIAQHCVANRPPNPGRYRILFETGKGKRRLYRPGDASDPGREGSKTVPDPDDVPPKYRELIDWYENNYAQRALQSSTADPLLSLRGSGRKLWFEEHADEYVRRLRESWR